MSTYSQASVGQPAEDGVAASDLVIKTDVKARRFEDFPREADPLFGQKETQHLALGTNVKAIGRKTVMGGKPGGSIGLADALALCRVLQTEGQRWIILQHEQISPDWKMFTSCRVFRIYPDMVKDFLGDITIKEIEDLRKEIKACSDAQAGDMHKKTADLNERSGIVHFNAKIGKAGGASAHERRLQASVTFCALHDLFMKKYKSLYEVHGMGVSEITLPLIFESGKRFAKPAVLPAPQAANQTSAAGSKQPDVGAIAAE